MDDLTDRELQVLRDLVSRDWRMWDRAREVAPDNRAYAHAHGRQEELDALLSKLGGNGVGYSGGDG